MNLWKNIESSLESLHEEGSIAFVVSPELDIANEVNELKELFQRLYRAKYGGELQISSIKKDREIQLVISVFAKKEDGEE